MPRWPQVFEYLRNKRLKTISPEEASQLAESGKYVLVDVRPPDQYAIGHATGAVSVPLYQKLDFSQMDFQKVLKTIAYSFNGVTPIEANPKFVEQLKAAIEGGKGMIVMCEAGGTMVPSTNFPEGKASRSLQAAFKSIYEGVSTDVLHIERGLFGWQQASLPITGEFDPDIGKTPMAAEDAKFPRR